MKPLYQPNLKMLQKTTIATVATLKISSFFTSCTVDEVPTNSKNLIQKEIYLQRIDSLHNQSAPSNSSSTTTSGGVIDPPTPPVKGNNPPPPSNP